jgi:predicted DNA-binding transcriptional regulator AlpA
VEPLLLTPTEVCEMLQITLPALRELCRTRTRLRSPRPVLPCLKLHAKALRFRRSDVESWLNQIAESQSQAAKA